MASLLLLELLSSPFCMEVNAARAYQPYIKDLVANGHTDLSSVNQKNSAVLENVLSKSSVLTAPGYDNNGNRTFAFAPKGSIAVIPVQGAVLKNDFCGAIGTKTISRLSLEAANNKDIKGILYLCDSPGGAALGTAECASTIKSVSKIKPTVTYVENLMCSAALWIGTSANHVVANNSDFCMIGSIGTFITLEARNPNGPQIIEIYADASTEKNGESRAALAGDFQPMLDNVLNPLNNSFLAAVTKNRYGRGLNKDKVFKGRTFHQDLALSYGLVDKVGTIEDAINLIYKNA
jgi:protease-4